MRLFFLTRSVIGSINDKILILINRQVVLMGLKSLESDHSLISPLMHFVSGASAVDDKDLAVRSVQGYP